MPIHYGPLPPNPSEYDAWVDTSVVPFNVYVWNFTESKWCLAGNAETQVYPSDEVPSEPPIGCLRLTASGLERFNGTDWVATGLCSGSSGGGT